MWIFAEFGLLMPSIVPDEFVTEGTNNRLQVRARSEHHLTYFADNYMEPGSFEPIYATPQMDYNFRFHTTHGAFAKAMVEAMMEIDYDKFKPAAEKKVNGVFKYKGATEYHGVLNSIWSAVCRLNAPGGVWSDPGYEGYIRNTVKYPKVNEKGGKNFTGSTFFDDDAPVATGRHLFSNQDGTSAYGYSGYADLFDDEDNYAEKVLDTLQGVPYDQWEDACTEDEYFAITKYMDKYPEFNLADWEAFFGMSTDADIVTGQLLDDEYDEDDVPMALQPIPQVTFSSSVVSVAPKKKSRKTIRDRFSRYRK